MGLDNGLSDDQEAVAGPAPDFAPGLGGGVDSSITDRTELRD